MAKFVFFASIFCLILGYKFFGKYLDFFFKINEKQKTPAHVLNDGMDYSPTKHLILFGHHFSSIAGAGPIVGPIVAALYFGWVPALIWIVLGAIFFGGLHDYSTLIMSVRNQGKSIAEVIKDKLGKKTYILLLILLFLILEYVLIVFLNLTATTFVQNKAVSSASILYIFLALIFGFFLVRLKIKKIFLFSLPFVIILFLITYVSNYIPILMPKVFGLETVETWQIILLGYCFFASILPVFVLLQPRDYLASYMLYFSLIVSFIGILFLKNLDINYVSFIPLKERSNDLLKIFPFLFITVACGAISGFHSLVSSGTTSKQIANEKDVKIIGYGSMITEAVLAVIALITIMLLTQNEAVSLNNPMLIFANGMGRFFTVFGLNVELGNMIGLLILSTFLLTSLDTATRIARYILQEIFNKNSRQNIFLYSFFGFIYICLIFIKICL